MSLISISELSFGYRDQPLFRDLAIDMEDNQWVAVIGVNGAGKSTLMNLLLGHLVAASGRILVDGQPPGSRQLKPHIGSSLQDIDFPENIRVWEILQFIRSHYRQPMPLDTLLEDFFIADFKDKKCGELSGGMRRRVAMACAFAGRPRMLFLDEPMTGLDAESRTRLLDNIARYQRDNRAFILMISHHPGEISPFVRRFLVLRKQQPPRWITPAEIRDLLKLRVVAFECDRPVHFRRARQVDVSDGRFRIVTADSDEIVRELNRQTGDYRCLDITRLQLDTVLQDYL